MKEVYSDAFVLHDETVEDPHELNEIKEKLAQKGEKLTETEKMKRRSTKSLMMEDTRKDLDNTWTKFFKYQPLWKIRNYFGEKFALYFAWSGTLITTLWVPTLFGIGIFIYGLYLRFVTIQTFLCCRELFTFCCPDHKHNFNSISRHLNGSDDSGLPPNATDTEK